MNTNILHYHGAGVDDSVLDFRRGDYNRVICCDTLPNKSHCDPDMAGYEDTKDRPSFVSALKKVHNITHEKGDVLYGKRFEYRMNTSGDESCIIPNVMNDIYIRGFASDMDYSLFNNVYVCCDTVFPYAFESIKLCVCSPSGNDSQGESYDGDCMFPEGERFPEGIVWVNSDSDSE